MGDSSLYSVELSLGAGNPRREFLQFGQPTPHGTYNIYIVHDDVKFYYAPGQRPSVTALSHAGTYVALICRIVGTRPAPV